MQIATVVETSSPNLMPQKKQQQTQVMLSKLQFLLPFVILLIIAQAKGNEERFLRYEDGHDVFDEEGNYDPEASMRARAKAVETACLHFASTLSPERGTIRWQEAIPPPKLGDTLNVFRGVLPQFQVCTPRNTNMFTAWKEYHAKVEEEFGVGDKKAKKDDEDDRRKNAARLKVVAVTHPLSRIVLTFLKDFMSARGGKFDVIRKTFQVPENYHLRFKDFVKFLVDGPKYFRNSLDLLKDEELNSKWKPFYQDCGVCHSDNFPTFVIKSDDPDKYRLDVETLQEIFGLEDIDFPFSLEEFPLYSNEWGLYSLLSKSELDKLVEFLHTDLKIFQYSTDPYYSLIAEKSKNGQTP